MLGDLQLTTRRTSLPQGKMLGVEYVGANKTGNIVVLVIRLHHRTACVTFLLFPVPLGIILVILKHLFINSTGGGGTLNAPS